MAIRMYAREELEEGQLIQWVGVHVLAWEQWKRDYGIPDWEYAFVKEDDDDTEED